MASSKPSSKYLLRKKCYFKLYIYTWVPSGKMNIGSQLIGNFFSYVVAPYISCCLQHHLVLLFCGKNMFMALIQFLELTKAEHTSEMWFFLPDVKNRVSGFSSQDKLKYFMSLVLLLVHFFFNLNRSFNFSVFLLFRIYHA